MRYLPRVPTTPSPLPIPPRDILMRIGPMGEEDPVGVYERSGADHRALIESVLPDDWTWPERRVLDFGCGVGRVLRQFAPEAATAEFWGCELDPPSIAWMERELSPPFQFFETSDTPSLPQEQGTFDLIYAFSVYTHLTDHWAGWLLEHHRVLKDGGLLFVTFLGEGMTEHLIDEPWDEDRIGMNTLMHGNPWDHGGPIAFNSPWWIHAHWGRAFEIVELRPRIDSENASHGCVLLRKKSVQLDEGDLIRLEPDEPREITALQHQIVQQRQETLQLRELHQNAVANLEAALKVERERREALEAGWRERLRSSRFGPLLRRAKRRLGR
jgi:SAM-dependent methyltransferase